MNLLIQSVLPREDLASGHILHRSNRYTEARSPTPCFPGAGVAGQAHCTAWDYVTLCDSTSDKIRLRLAHPHRRKYETSDKEQDLLGVSKMSDLDRRTRREGESD